MTSTNLMALGTAALVLAGRAVTGGEPGARGLTVPRDTVTRKYEVQLAFTGYTGLASSADCEALVDLQGYDSLVGTLTGLEGLPDPGDGVVYTGRLSRRTKVDYCLSRGRRGPDDDERAWCVVRLTGTARMLVTLEVHGEEGRGAWLTAEPDSMPPESVRAEGDCHPADTDQVRADYPGGESGGSPSGQSIAESDPARFFTGGIPRLRIGYFPVDPVEGGWALRVVREVR